MAENTHGGGRRAFGDLTNLLGKRPASTDLEKSSGGIKIRRIENDTGPRKQSDENSKTGGGGKGVIYGNLFDGVAKENFERPSIFRGRKVQHMAAEAAGLVSKLVSKEASEVRDHCVSMDSSGLSDKDLESSLESGDDYEDDDDDGLHDDFPGHFGSSEFANAIATNDGECLTQEEMVGSSGNQNPLSSLDYTTGGNMPCSNVHSASMKMGGSEEAVPTKSCTCSFCTKAAFMWTDLHYQDARSRLSVLKKSIKFARTLEAKSRDNEYAANAIRSGRPAEMEFQLFQQQRSLFLYTENVLVRESTQLHSAFVKLKELRENCKTDLEKLSNSSLGK